MEDTFLILQVYISKYWTCSITNIKANTTLDDLGMFGDDKLDFLNDYSREFNVDISGFDFDKYIEPETDMSYHNDAIYRFFLKKRLTTKFDKETISISMLVDGIKNGKLIH